MLTKKQRKARTRKQLQSIRDHRRGFIIHESCYLKTPDGGVWGHWQCPRCPSLDTSQDDV